MKRSILGILTMLTLLTLAGCGSLPFLNGSPSASRNGQNFSSFDPASLPVEKKLGAAILKLEGSDQAVTAAQAQAMLPLWKALRTLSADNNTTADEITALNNQIKDTLTPAQIQAIEKMTWAQGDTRDLMQKFGGMGGGNNPGTPQTTPGATSNRRRNGNGGGGFPGGPGGPPPGAMMMPGGANGFAQRTPVPGQTERREAAGMNLMFAEPVIRLLESKLPK